MRHYGAKRDGNERPIIDALKDAGCEVMQLSGAGVPDLLVYLPTSGLLRMMEVKQRKGKLTDAQRKTFPVWPAWICRTVDEAKKAMGIT